MKGLTETQQKVLNFIQEFIELHRYSPSYREIMEHFDFSSPATVYKYIRTLQRKGALTAEKHCSRSLSLTHTSHTSHKSQDCKLPFIGNIINGYPIELFIQSQLIDVPKFLVPHAESTYLLRAQGESLHEELIGDGDLLLIEARQEAQAGELIIALVNQHDAIVKHYYPEGQYIRLESAHTQLKPLILRHEDLLIQGAIIGVIRTY